MRQKKDGSKGKKTYSETYTLPPLDDDFEGSDIEVSQSNPEK